MPPEASISIRISVPKIDIRARGGGNVFFSSSKSDISTISHHMGLDGEIRCSSEELPPPQNDC